MSSDEARPVAKDLTGSIERWIVGLPDERA